MTLLTTVIFGDFSKNISKPLDRTDGIYEYVYPAIRCK